jgi:regulator of replication initiation timing
MEGTMMGIKEIYEIACCIKKLVEENDELKYENQKLKQVEKEYRDFFNSQITRNNEFISDTVKVLIKSYEPKTIEQKVNINGDGLSSDMKVTIEEKFNKFD